MRFLVSVIKEKNTAVVFADRSDSAFGRLKHNQNQPAPADRGIGSRFPKSVGGSSKIRCYDKKRNIDVRILRICMNKIASAVLFYHN